MSAHLFGWLAIAVGSPTCLVLWVLAARTSLRNGKLHPYREEDAR